MIRSVVTGLILILVVLCGAGTSEGRLLRDSHCVEDDEAITCGSAIKIQQSDTSYFLNSEEKQLGNGVWHIFMLSCFIVLSHHSFISRANRL